MHNSPHGQQLDDAGEGAADSNSDDEDADGAVSPEEGDEDVPEKIPPKQRDARKKEDKHRCRVCGAAGPGAGGVAQLHVHHADPDPDHCALHALENLITLCIQCHDWLHKQPDDGDVDVEISSADERYLRPNDYEILRYLYTNGPSMASDITAALTADVTEVAVRERLWLLMGLDRMVESREKQLVDRDAETGEWGPPNQVAQSVRGRIPGDVQLLLQRIEDEVVRQAVARGCDRDMVAAVLDVHSRTTWSKERRAYACAFPLDALSRGDEVSRVVGDDVSGGAAQFDDDR